MVPQHHFTSALKTNEPKKNRTERQDRENMRWEVKGGGKDRAQKFGLGNIIYF